MIHSQMRSAIKGGFVISACWLGLAYVYKANCLDAVLRCQIVGALKVTVPGTRVKVCFLRIVG